MHQRNKIDVIVKYSHPVAAGIEVNTLETYSVLAKEGWEVTFHTSKDTLTEKNVLQDEEMHRGIRIRRYRFGWLGYFPQIDWATTDVVCLHNFNVLPHFILMVRVGLLKLCGRKTFGFFLTPHGGFNPEWSIFPQGVALIKRWYHYTLGAFMINCSMDGVRAVSEWERIEMVKHGVKESLVKVISNGLENEAFLDVDQAASKEVKKAVEGYGRYIIQVGRVYPIKNYETTIRALALVPSDVKYLIVGPPAGEVYRATLERLIGELGLKERVIFAGVVRGVDKYYLIKHAAMMVHMALWESFCNVVHEGMSQGLVCIVADNTALPLLIQDGVNGYCLSTKDHEKLSERIRFVLKRSDSEEIIEMRRRSIEFGRKNSWSEVAARMAMFYLQSIPTKHRSFNGKPNQS